MGMGIELKCSKCNKEDQLLFGIGFLSFQLNFKKVAYICSKCGNYEQRDVHLHGDIEEIKKDIERMEKGLPLETKSKYVKCSKCGNRMKKYEESCNSKGERILPKLFCKDCGGELVEGLNICWD